jgi:hypothetical protein
MQQRLPGGDLTLADPVQAKLAEPRSGAPLITLGPLDVSASCLRIAASA